MPRKGTRYGFNEKKGHTLKYGLKIVHRDDMNVVTAVDCKFCLYFGREQKIDRARSPWKTNARFRTFRTDGYTRHLESEHAVKWEEYSKSSDLQKKMFFGIDDVHDVNFPDWNENQALESLNRSVQILDSSEPQAQPNNLENQNSGKEDDEELVPHVEIVGLSYEKSPLNQNLARKKQKLSETESREANSTCLLPEIPNHLSPFKAMKDLSNLSTKEKELHELLTLWYNAGYRTGKYHATLEK